MRRHFIHLSALITLLVVLAGCNGNRVQVQVPPKAPVDGIKNIAILPFENVSADPGAAFELERLIAQDLRESGWYGRVETLRNSTFYGGLTPTAGRLTDFKQIGEQVRADAIIYGTVTYYTEDLYMHVPTCTFCDTPNRAPSWSARQDTKITVHFEATMVNVHTGQTIMFAKATGEDTDYTTHSINWNDRNTPPPSSIVPKPTRQYVVPTRDRALRRAATRFSRDLLPTYEWRSID